MHPKVLLPQLLVPPQQVEVIVDLCSGGSLEGQTASPRKASHDTNATTAALLPSPPDYYSCRVAATLPEGARLLNVGQPLQVGGVAYPPPDHVLQGWPEPLLAPPLLGCVRNLRVNGEVSHPTRGSGINEALTSMP